MIKPFSLFSFLPLLLFSSVLFTQSLLEGAPYVSNRGTRGTSVSDKGISHGTRGYWNNRGSEYGRGSYARYYGRNPTQQNYNYRMNENNPWFRNNQYYGVGYPTAYDYQWYGYGGVDYQNYWASYPSTFSNWTYPSYPYNGTFYKSSNPYQQR